MAIFSPSRVVQVAAKLTAANQSAILATVSSVSIGQNVIPYDLDIYSILATGFIRSLPQTFVPTDNPSDHSSVREFKAAQFMEGPKVGVQLVLVSPDTSEFFIGEPIPFFNNGGLFVVNISQAISELVKYQLQSGYSLKAQTADLGHGTLTSQDQIHFTGYGERSGQFLQDAQETIYTVP